MWLKNQFEIGCVYVGIGEHGAQGRCPLACQMRERRRQARLACTAFAAQNHELFHAQSLRYMLLS